MTDFFDFHNINTDGCEDVEYDIPELPIYIRDGYLAEFKNYTFKAHYHSDWEFIAVTSGKMKYNVNGKIVEIEEGSGIFVNSNFIHFGFSNKSVNCKYVCVLVHPSLFCINQYIERKFVSPIRDSGCEYIILPNQVATKVVTMFTKKQAGSGTLYFDILQDLFSIAVDIFELVETRDTPVMANRSFVPMKTMLDYISKNYSEKITLCELAESANVCKNYCISLFKKYTNRTPIEYLTEYRIQKACNMLKHTDKSVSEIALDCHLSDSSYFCKIFKRSIGVTPHEYKQQILHNKS